MGIEFGKRFKEIRNNNKLTQKELAELCGTVPSSVVAWEKGTNYPSASLFLTLEKTLNIKISDLIALDSAPPSPVYEEPDPTPPNPDTIELPPDLQQFSPKGVKMIPVIGMASAAHFDPSLCQLSDLFHGVDEMVPCVIPGCENCFGLRIVGDSMSPALRDGDVVAVSDNLPATGDICIVMHRTDGILCKEWYWRNGIIKLLSLNEEEGKSYQWTKAEFKADNPFTWRWRVEGIIWRKNIKGR